MFNPPPAHGNPDSPNASPGASWCFTAAYRERTLSRSAALNFATRVLVDRLAVRADNKAVETAAEDASRRSKLQTLNQPLSRAM